MGRPITLDHIPPEHHEGVGYVSNAWAHLEGVVERIVWRLARINDNRGLSITTHMGIRARMDAACSLANLEFPSASETTRLVSMQGKVFKVYGVRNEIVHSRTLHITNETIRVTYKARGKLISEAKQIEIGDYESAAKKILAVASKLRELLAQFNKLVEVKDTVR